MQLKMDKSILARFRRITEDEVNALGDMMESLLTSLVREADEREDRQVTLVMSLLDKLQDAMLGRGDVAAEKS